jgi:AraC-like DNA-binding protein
MTYDRHYLTEKTQVSTEIAMSQRTISIVFIRSMLDGGSLPNKLRHKLLQQAGIPSAALNSERERVTPLQLSKLNKLVTDATNDEGMGHYPQTQKIGTLATMVRYTQGADDLHRAINRNIEFYNLFNLGFTLSLTLKANQAIYRLEPKTGVKLSNWVYEQQLMVNHRFFCWLAGTSIPLHRVNLNYSAPSYREEYHYLFFSDTRFSQPYSEIIFSQQLLKLPLVRSKSELEDYLSRVPHEFLSIPTRERSYTDRIRRQIKNYLPELPPYEQLAESFGLTPQTLRRRLRQEGCDYRLIKNELIRDMAIDSLLHDSKDIKTISYLLGFSEPSAFIRSFKKWTGATPKQYREQHSTGPKYAQA